MTKREFWNERKGEPLRNKEKVEICIFCNKEIKECFYLDWWYGNTPDNPVCEECFVGESKNDTKK